MSIVSEVEKAVEAFVMAVTPIVKLFNPKAAVILSELDVALGIINYAASKAENVQNQSNLTSIATTLSNDASLIKPFLDKVIFGNTTVSQAVVEAGAIAQSVQSVAAIVSPNAASTLAPITSTIEKVVMELPQSPQHFNSSGSDLS